MNRKLSLALAASFAAVAAASRAESVDYGTVTLIRDEGFNGSKVMETLAQLTDVLGPRLTGSPAAKKANEWTRDQLATWGLVNAHLESFGPFGRGWSGARVRRRRSTARPRASASASRRPSGSSSWRKRPWPPSSRATATRGSCGWRGAAPVRRA